MFASKKEKSAVIQSERFGTQLGQFCFFLFQKRIKMQRNNRIDMNKRPSKAKGILGNPFETRAMDAQNRDILRKASGIRARDSYAGQVRAAVTAIRDYVAVSSHSVSRKIQNLKVDLAKTQDPPIRRALEKAIAKLQ